MWAETKGKRHLSLVALLFSALLVLFVMAHERHTYREQQATVETYARMIASSLWNFEPQAPTDYLTTAAARHDYAQVRVVTVSNQEFVNVTYNKQRWLDDLLVALHLIRCQEIGADIKHNTVVIGRLTVNWCNRNVYSYGYLLLVMLLILVAGWFYLATLQAKQDLESRVEERTAALHSANSTLRENEQRYRTIFENTMLGMYRTTPSGEILMANPALLQMLGYSSFEELAQHNLEEDWYTPENPRSKFKEKMTQEGKIAAMQSRWIKLDGSTLFVTESARAIYGESGEILYYEGMVRDITEHEQLLTKIERRNIQLQTAAEVSRAASTILNPKVLIERAVELIRMHFNFYYVGLFLVDKEGKDAVLRAGTGEPGRQMLAEGHQLEVGGHSMIGWCVEQGQARIALDVGEEAIRFDNPWLPETRSEMALPLLSREQWCIGAVTVQSVRAAAFSKADVAALQSMADHLAIALENAWLHERVRRHADELETRVAERTAELTAVNQELESFSYSVSHDLRAPLRSIDGFSQALLEDYAEQLDTIGQDYLQRVRGAAQRMGQLIGDLLNLSRTTRGEMHREEVNLSELVQKIAADLHRLQPEREVEFNLEPNLTAYCDVRLLRAVLENLLGNAWKFTSKHERARIEFGLLEQSGEPTYFVRDDGAGFDMTYADKLFGAFQRLHRMTEFEGTGVGLATVQRIINRHGGRIWAESIIEKGATFYFTLAVHEE